MNSLKEETRAIMAYLMLACTTLSLLAALIGARTAQPEVPFIPADEVFAATDEEVAQAHAEWVASQAEVPDPCGLETVVCEEEEVHEPTKVTKGGLPQAVTVTAYTSYANQTDSTPCISADGSNICDRYAEGELICATNDHPLGTTLHVHGYGVCTVADRMNSRYTGTGRVDIYLGYDTPAALQWGVKQVIVKTIK